MYGVSKETVTKEEINKYKLANGQKERQMTEIIKLEGVKEIIILDNSFRNEYYLYVDESIFSHGQFLRYLSRETNKSLEEIILETYSKFNEDVLRHLYEIANGYLSSCQNDIAILIALEQSLKLAKYLKTVGDILNKLFKEVIRLVYSLKLNKEIQPLNIGQVSKCIYLLRKNLKQLKNKNYILTIEDPRLIILSKILLIAGAQSVTITHKDNKELEKQYGKTRNELTEAEKNNFYMADLKSLNYRLSKADAIIINLNTINILSEENQEELSEIRQTRKIQYIIDIGKEPLKELNCPSLDIELINPNINFDYNEDEQQQAIIEFENILSVQINKFMNFFEGKQLKDLTEFSY